MPTVREQLSAKASSLRAMIAEIENNAALESAPLREEVNDVEKKIMLWAPWLDVDVDQFEKKLKDSFTDFKEHGSTILVNK